MFFRGIPIFKGLAPLALKLNVREYDINIPSKKGLLSEAFLALFLTTKKKSVLYKWIFSDNHASRNSLRCRQIFHSFQI